MVNGTGQPAHRLLSVGHSDHEWTAFVALLQGAGITAIADVRSQPFSKWLPRFNRSELEPGLGSCGIAYVFLGPWLGGRPDDPDVYDADGRVDYERVRRTGFFHEGLRRLQHGLKDYTIGMLCSEEDPLDCHRGLMIAPALLEIDISTDHVRKSGAIETMAQMEERLLAATRVGAGLVDGLFAAQITCEDRRHLLAEAYRKQARRRAFRPRELPAGGDAGERE